MAYLTTNQRDGFGMTVLNDVLDWIRDNLDPDQIWDDEELVEAILTEMTDVRDKLFVAIAGEFAPADIFEIEVLSDESQWYST